MKEELVTVKVDHPLGSTDEDNPSAVYPINAGYVVNESDLHCVKSYDAGFYKRYKAPGDYVSHGECIAEVVDPYEGYIKSQIISQTDGIVFFAHTAPIVMENEVVYKIIKRMHE